MAEYYFSEYDPIMGNPGLEAARGAALGIAGSGELSYTINGQNISSITPTRSVVGSVTVPTAAGVGLGAGAGLIGPTLGSPDVPAVLGAVPAVASALGISLPAGITAGLGAAGAIYGVLQALGLGEGGGLFGNNLLGGDTTTVGGVPMGGPGLPEPQGGWTIVREWPIGDNKRGYYITKPGANGRLLRKGAIVDLRTKQWRVWNWPRPRLAVIGKNMPRHQMIVRLRKNLMRHTHDAKTILKLTSPASLKGPKRRRR